MISGEDLLEIILEVIEDEGIRQSISNVAKARYGVNIETELLATPAQFTKTERGITYTYYPKLYSHGHEGIYVVTAGCDKLAVELQDENFHGLGESEFNGQIVKGTEIIFSCANKSKFS